MKKMSMVVVFTLVLSALMPVAGQAQGSIPPPPCCPRSPGIAADEGAAPDAEPEAEMVVPARMLRAWRLSRGQFIDRLAEALFPGKTVDLVIAWKVVSTRPDSSRQKGDASVGSGDTGLIAVEETWFYRVPRGRLSEEQMEKLEQVSLTDGDAVVRVLFAAAGTDRIAPPIRPGRMP